MKSRASVLEVKPEDLLHQHIADALGWTIKDVHSYSLATLRDLVRPVDKALSEEITKVIREGGHIRSSLRSAASLLESLADSKPMLDKAGQSGRLQPMATKKTATKIRANAPVSMAEVKSVIDDVMAKLKEEGTKGALCGGFAMQAYGSTRLTSDVDIIVSSHPSFVTDGSPMAIGGVSTEIDSVPIDFIERADHYRDLYDEALRTAKAMIPGNSAPVIRPEVMVALKMVAGRPKDDHDLYFLLSSVKMDNTYLNKVVTKYLGRYALTDLDNTRSMAKFLKDNNKL